MSTTTDNPPEYAADDEMALPDYAGTVAECGDPQPVIDELTEWLDGQEPPQIPTDPEQSAEPEETTEDETSEADHD